MNVRQILFLFGTLLFAACGGAPSAPTASPSPDRETSAELDWMRSYGHACAQGAAITTIDEMFAYHRVLAAAYHEAMEVGTPRLACRVYDELVNYFNYGCEYQDPAAREMNLDSLVWASHECAAIDQHEAFVALSQGRICEDIPELGPDSVTRRPMEGGGSLIEEINTDVEARLAQAQEIFDRAEEILNQDPTSVEGNGLVMDALQTALATRNSSTACAGGRILVALASQCRPIGPQPYDGRIIGLAWLASRYCEDHLHAEVGSQASAWLRSCR